MPNSELNEPTEKSELTKAIKKKDIKLVKELLEKKARPGVSELSAACVRGFTEIVELLILAEGECNSKYNNNAVKEYVNAYDYGQTPLITTCMEGHIDTARLPVQTLIS